MYNEALVPMLVYSMESAALLHSPWQISTSTHSPFAKSNESSQLMSPKPSQTTPLADHSKGSAAGGPTTTHTLHTTSTGPVEVVCSRFGSNPEQPRKALCLYYG